MPWIPCIHARAGRKHAAAFEVNEHPGFSGTHVTLKWLDEDGNCIEVERLDRPVTATSAEALSLARHAIAQKSNWPFVQI